MSQEYRKGLHTIYDIQYHFVWVTKYRYHILKEEIALRGRELIRQRCEARNITISDNHKRYNWPHNPLNMLFNSTLTFLIRRCAIQSGLKI